jgi:hypothetical protein
MRIQTSGVSWPNALKSSLTRCSFQDIPVLESNMLLEFDGLAGDCFLPTTSAFTGGDGTASSSRASTLARWGMRTVGQPPTTSTGFSASFALPIAPVAPGGGEVF